MQLFSRKLYITINIYSTHFTSKTERTTLFEIGSKPNYDVSIYGHVSCLTDDRFLYLM